VLPPVCRNYAKAELERVCQRRYALRPSSIFAHYYRILPIGYVVPYPARNERLRYQVVNRALEEALHLTGVEIEGYDMVHAGNVE